MVDLGLTRTHACLDRPEVRQKYGGDNEVTWAKFLDELERLPPEVHVLGVNDYWFLDGYKRVRQAKRQGRLANIREVFPVVEFRLGVFGGTQGSLRRQNMHVLFDPEIEPEVIESQFLNALQANFQLLPDHAGDWSGLVTRDSLENLGKAIKAAAPPEKLVDYGSDMVEGFNSLVVDMKNVHQALDKHFFKGRHLIGLGKAEWASIKWNDQAVASKRDIINQANFLFTAFAAASTWSDVVEKLKGERVQHRLFDCSDAHAFSNATHDERLRNCRNWVNAEPTFAGLVTRLRNLTTESSSAWNHLM